MWPVLASLMSKRDLKKLEESAGRPGKGSPGRKSSRVCMCPVCFRDSKETSVAKEE